MTSQPICAGPCQRCNNTITPDWVCDLCLSGGTAPTPHPTPDEFAAARTKHEGLSSKPCAHEDCPELIPERHRQSTRFRLQKYCSQLCANRAHAGLRLVA